MVSKVLLRKVLILVGFIPSLLFGQDIAPDDARAAFDEGAYAFALPYYAGAYLNGSKKLKHFRYGVCAVHTPSHREKGIEVLDSLSENGLDRAMFWAGVGLQRAGKNEKALARFHGYKELKDEKIPTHRVERYIQIAVRAQVRRNENVYVNGRRIRYSEEMEASRALMTHDGEELFFRPYRRSFVFVADMSEGGLRVRDTLELQKGSELAGIASDGSTVILSRPQQKKPWRRDLYRVHREGDEWSEPQAFGENINSSYDESRAWIDAKGKRMIFSSDRKGGSGGLDLYTVRKLPTGSWAKPKNLGPSVNSSYDEDAPCLLANGKDLYFISNGHQTMGGRDIFRTYYQEDEERWIVPEAPGYPVNNEEDELAVSLTGDGKNLALTRAFRYAPHHRTEHIELLYKFDHLKPVKGKVLSEDGEPLKAKITLLDPKERTVRGIYRSVARDGSFVLAIRPHKDFELIIEAEGHVPETHRVKAGDKGMEFRLEEE